MTQQLKPVEPSRWVHVPVATTANASSERVCAVVQSLIEIRLADAAATVKCAEGDIESTRLAINLTIARPELAAVGHRSVRPRQDRLDDVTCPTQEDRNTILAALRFYQAKGMGEPANRADDIHDIATNGGNDTSYDSGDIDDLCERINCTNARAALPHFSSVAVEIPGGALRFASESSYTATMRACRAEQAMKAWRVADESDEEVTRATQPDEHAVLLLLADLRHYCDTHGLDFAWLDRLALHDYLDQLANDRHPVP